MGDVPIENLKLPKKMKKKKSKKAIQPSKPSVFIQSPDLGQRQDTSNCADSAGDLFNVSPLKRPE